MFGCKAVLCSDGRGLGVHLRAFFFSGSSFGHGSQVFRIVLCKKCFLLASLTFSWGAVFSLKELILPEPVAVVYPQVCVRFRCFLARRAELLRELQCCDPGRESPVQQREDKTTL